MKRFKFRLEAVLNHRVIQEELALSDFAKAQAEAAANEAHLTALRMKFDSVVGGRSTAINVMDIALRERYLDCLRTEIHTEERTRETLLANLQDALARLVSARQAREGIEKIRQSDLEAYRRAELHAEQESLDEMTTMRRLRTATASAGHSDVPEGLAA
jgi:flagellar export protein FliJ